MATKKGGRRKTARRAYVGLKRRARSARSYVRRRRGAIRVRRRSRGKGNALVKARSMTALKECGWITAGGTAGLLTRKYYTGSMRPLGLAPEYFLGAAAIGYGIGFNKPKAIYMGFGALYPRLQGEIAKLIGV